MVKRNVRIEVVRLDPVDIDKFGSGVLLALKELPTSTEPDSDSDTAEPEEAVS